MWDRASQNWGQVCGTQHQNGVNDNNWNDNDNANDNVGVVGGLSPELLSPPFLPLPNALYPPAKRASDPRRICRVALAMPAFFRIQDFLRR
jgi:hypothetical protein